MKKVLLLSLGTGINVEKEVLEYAKQNNIINEKQTYDDIPQNQKKACVMDTLYGKDKFPYQKAKYRFENEKIIHSEFIAEPLIAEEKPNVIIIMGTIKSIWAGFYLKFADKNKVNFDDFSELVEYSFKKAIDIGNDELSGIEEEIKTIFQNLYFKSLTPEENKELEVRVILTRYGINQEQLVENYERLKSLRTIFDKDEQYEVSFDITHSFRSMPLYNLVIFYYFKDVFQYNIHIKNVYYGNFESSRENKGITQIVNLGELVNVLDLSGGIKEFNNTGNLVEVLKQLNVKDDYKSALTRFDWATQINDFDAIIGSLSDIMQDNTKGDNIGKYADLENMIKQTLTNKLNIKDIKELELKNIQQDNELFGKLQYNLAYWYYQQNRYGQAIATALEALRSYLVPMYLRFKEIEVNWNNRKNENYRKAAYDLLKYYKKNNNNDLLIELRDTSQKVIKIRNMFAHNLAGEISDSQSYGETKQDIDDFMESMMNFYKKMHDKQGGKEEVYKKLTESSKGKKITTEVTIRFIITNKELFFTSQWDCLKEANKKTYKVYKLPKNICCELQKDSDRKRTKNYYSALLIEYINKYFDKSQISVLLDKDFEWWQLANFVTYLRNAGVKEVKLINLGFPTIEIIETKSCDLLADDNIKEVSLSQDDKKLIADNKPQPL